MSTLWSLLHYIIHYNSAFISLSYTQSVKFIYCIEVNVGQGCKTWAGHPSNFGPPLGPQAFWTQPSFGFQQKDIPTLGNILRTASVVVPATVGVSRTTSHHDYTTGTHNMKTLLVDAVTAGYLTKWIYNEIVVKVVGNRPYTHSGHFSVMPQSGWGILES